MIHQHIFAGRAPWTGASLSGEELRPGELGGQIKYFKQYLVNNRVDNARTTNSPPWNGIEEIWFASESDRLQALRDDESYRTASEDTTILDTHSHVLRGDATSYRLSGVKIVRLLRRKPGVRIADFRGQLADVYGPLVLQVPGLRRYVQCVTCDSAYTVGEPLFDGLEQLWFDSISALHSACNTLPWREAGSRLADVVDPDSLFSMTVREKWIIPPADESATGEDRQQPPIVMAQPNGPPSSIPWRDRPRCGAQAIAEQLRAASLIGETQNLLIGNPGSGEEWLYLEMMSEVHLGLAEAAVGSIADGVGRFYSSPAVVIAHGFVGLSGLQGSIFNAAQRQSPLLVIVGTADTHAHTGETHMWADIQGAAVAARAKFVKFATDPATLLRDLRDVIVQAMIPPFGPVVFVVGSDVAASLNDEPVRSIQLPNPRLAPPVEEVKRLADLLLRASRPTILIGDGIARSNAHQELREVAELLGTDVWASMESEVNLPRDHPLFRGNLGHMDANRGRELLKEADFGLVVGTPVYQTVFNSRVQLFPPGVDIAVINHDIATSIRGHNDISFPILGDPQTVLRQLANVLQQLRQPNDIARAERRLDELRRIKQESLDQRRHEQLARAGVNMGKFGHRLEQRLARISERPVIVNEALVGAVGLTDFICNPNIPGKYYDTSGGSLGEWGGSVGIALTGVPTIGFIGDGGFHYVLSALWNAVRKRVPLGLVVANNGTYGLLYDNMKAALSARGFDPFSVDYPHFFRMPGVQYVKIAEGYGVGGTRVECENQIEPAIDRMLDAMQHKSGPFLIDLVISD